MRLSERGDSFRRHVLLRVGCGFQDPSESQEAWDGQRTAARGWSRQQQHVVLQFLTFAICQEASEKSHVQSSHVVIGGCAHAHM